MKILNVIIFGFLVIVSALIILINLKLYSGSNISEDKREDILLQLNFLEAELKTNDLGNRMQVIFPEGFVFSNVLYGLSWCEYGMSDTSESNKVRALNEALYAFNQINSENALSVFDPNMIPANGIFYLGWNNYLLSKILQLNSNFDGSEKLRSQFQFQCELIASSLLNSKTPFLQSYQNQSWPADMCAAMASVSLDNKSFNPKYGNLIAEWVKEVRSKTDPVTKLIPHEVNSTTGETLEGARGSSISLIIRLLSEIDRNFAREQFELYQQYFVSTTFGLPSINEYPKGQTGSGDIDSGPVIFGVGFAGTIVSIGTFSSLGHNEQADCQYKTINAFGLSYKTSQFKKYLFGELPIADAFIVWGRSTGLNSNDSEKLNSGFWRIKFQLISFSLIILMWSLYYSKSIIRKLTTK